MCKKTGNNMYKEVSRDSTIADKTRDNMCIYCYGQAYVTLRITLLRNVYYMLKLLTYLSGNQGHMPRPLHSVCPVTNSVRSF